MFASRPNRRIYCLGDFCQMFSLRVLHGFCLIFCKFQSGVAYKSVAYKNVRLQSVDYFLIPHTKLF